MTCYSDNEGNEEYYTDNSDYDISDSYSENEENEYMRDVDIDNIFNEDDIQYTQWKKLQISDTTIYVSNKGDIKLKDGIFNITKGVNIEGTPYRYVCIPINNYGDFANYYVHELVWVAFNGDIPDDWNVGHIDRDNKIYDNNLSNLNIFRRIVKRRFTNTLLF